MSEQRKESSGDALITMIGVIGGLSFLAFLMLEALSLHSPYAMGLACTAVLCGLVEFVAHVSRRGSSR